MQKIIRSVQAMYRFNAQDVFEMAIRIEENGAMFYRNAADLQENQTDREFFQALARMEDRHRLSFESMQKEICELEKTQPVFDTAAHASLYLKTMADSHGGEGNPAVLDLLTGREPMEAVIARAIGLEKESILFYLGLKDIVLPGSGQDKIKKIIDQEKRHIVQLNRFLKIAKITASRT